MSDEREKKIELIKNHIAEYPDFPKPGIIFRDIFAVLQKPNIFSVLRDVLVSVARDLTPKADCVAGLDARGFLFAPLIALELKLPFVPIRKKGKLPGNVKSYTYKLEYGEDTLQIQENALKNGQKVLLVDDLLATGGSLGASCKLISLAGGTVTASLVVIELKELKGRDNLPCQVHSIVQF